MKFKSFIKLFNKRLAKARKQVSKRCCICRARLFGCDHYNAVEFKDIDLEFVYSPFIPIQVVE